MKIFKKILLLSASCLLTSNLLAQETVCFKNNVDKPSTIKETPLDGGVCKGQLTLDQMQENGWEILDIKITPSNNKFNYSYYLIKNNSKNIVNEKSKKQYELSSKKVFSTKPVGVKLANVQNNKSTIDVGNLIVGQSGIVVHIYDNDKRLIVSNAKVISSNNNSSIIEFFKFDDLKQDALPTSNRVVEKGDVLVLNYMYNSSLLIAPSFDSFQAIRANFKSNNFIHSDIFAAKLKVNNMPYPRKKDFQEFAIEQNLGTIFFVLDNKVVIVDSKTFTILDSYEFSYQTDNLQMPFYTRVEEIEGSIFEFSVFSDKKNLNYEEYYKRILGISK